MLISPPPVGHHTNVTIHPVGFSHFYAPDLLEGCLFLFTAVSAHRCPCCCPLILLLTRHNVCLTTDRTRPSCLRCLKSGYACKGYDLGLRMQSLVVVTEPEGSQRLARIVAPPTAPAATTLTTAGPAPPPLHQLRHGLSRAAAAAATAHDGAGAGCGAAGIGTGSDEDDDGNVGRYKMLLGGAALEQHQRQQQARRRLDPPPEMNLSAFQEHMAFSYFFATYGWAYFWKPFLHLARETDLAPTASRMCSLALAYGHMGTNHADKSLKSTGLELYGRSLREVQSLLTRGTGAKTELAQLCVPIVILGMYSVRSSFGPYPSPPHLPLPHQRHRPSSRPCPVPNFMLDPTATWVEGVGG
jgi:hypothetical protein